MESLFRSIAVVASLLVVAGFVAFALEETGKGSRTQIEKLAEELGTPAPSAGVERRREREHGPVREAVDDANDVLLAPFTGVVSSRDIWVQRTVPAILALLVYGLGLTLVAGYLPKQRRPARDWRTT
jgi:hypothetical protein